MILTETETVACDALKPAFAATDKVHEAVEDLQTAFADTLANVERLATALAAITALTTAALADRRRGCPTYGLVSAAQIQRIVESTNHAGDRHE